jgi:hypothetical protein
MHSVADRRGGEEEPFICAECLVELHQATSTTLPVLRRLDVLESKVDTRLWILYFAFTVVLAIAAFLAGGLVFGPS